MSSHRVIALVLVGLQCYACSSLEPATLAYDQVDPPGFFDIGLGYGRVTDTRDTGNDDAEGLIASFKAYPLGRWYGEPKKEELQIGVSAVDRVAVARILAVDEAKRASFFLLQERGVSESRIVELEQHTQAILDWAATVGKHPSDVEFREPEALKEIQSELDSKAGPNDAKEGVRESAGLEQDVRNAFLEVRGWQQGRQALADAAKQVNTLLSRPDVKVTEEVRLSLRNLVTSAPLSDFERRILGELVDFQQLGPKWHVIRERNDWYNRLSVFYGRSVSDFDSGGLESHVNVVGMGWDVSPDLALQVGWGFYEVDEDNNGMIDSDSSLFLGVTLNLFAFKALGEAILNAGDETD